MISKIVWRAFTLLYGTLVLTLFTTFALLDGSLFQRPTEKEKKELAIAQQKFWDLSKSPLGLKHKFFTLKDGCKLHYVEKLGTNSSKNLTIFIHGFPDSWILWQRLLTSSRLSQNSALVAVDLPGYGGSDGLPNYSANAVLETMTAFILGMREEYITSRGDGAGKVFVVSHDWGSIIGYRLASEASQLADRFIISCAVYPQQTYATIKAHFASSSKMLHTWTQRPFSVRLLKSALKTISPVLKQASKSGYVFAFNLPSPLANFCGRMGNMWLLRLMHRIATGATEPSGKPLLLGFTEAAEAMTASLGPGPAQFGASDAKEGYPDSVKRRAPTGGWLEKIRIYREGLVLGQWEKSIETIVRLSEIDRGSPHRRSSSGAGLFENGPAGSLKARATVVYGKKDPAFESKLTLEDISDYLTKGSQVVVLNEAGHWVPIEKDSAEVLEEVVGWALEGEEGSLKTRLERFGTVKVTIDK
ncbi:abhydrolase domain-containing protein 9 [Glonium stellatum]|uniref:Abhydrolase domain-containing protein 9 n=1 Tax=Glonium stellatum TaxID=574774 RepID=A0A8E2F8T6_9PEZI|nr:abhydrolase domain-containing protein 9 [Glonium stellatum]